MMKNARLIAGITRRRLGLEDIKAFFAPIVISDIIKFMKEIIHSKGMKNAVTPTIKRKKNLVFPLETARL